MSIEYMESMLWSQGERSGDITCKYVRKYLSNVVIDD